MTDAQTVLRTRARALAQPIDDDIRADSELLEVLIVLVEGSRLGVPMDVIAAIAVAGSVAPLPRAVRPEYGVTAWRGRPLTVFALASGPVTIEDTSRFIIVGDARRADAAILVDAVDDAVAIFRKSLQVPPPHRFGSAVMGMTDDAMLIVDVRELIAARMENTNITRPSTGIT